jgi:transketolase
MTTTNLTAVTDVDQLCVDTIRMLSIDAVQRANSGHPGTPMALAPIGYVLFTRIMRHAPQEPDWPDRDRFVLSAGHASMLLYSLLYLTGYGLTLDDLRTFRQLGSRAAGHPERGLAPGIETTTGPLGQGLATCVGLALGERMLNARFGRRLIDHRTFCIASDGDMEEGISSEACSLAGHLALGRLVVFYDDNHISIEGPTSLAFSEDVGARFEAYGWHVQNLGEDLTLDRIEDATRIAVGVEDRPSMIICRTHIAPGAPHKQDPSTSHARPSRTAAAVSSAAASCAPNGTTGCVRAGANVRSWSTSSSGRSGVNFQRAGLGGFPASIPPERSSRPASRRTRCFSGLPSGFRS